MSQRFSPFLAGRIGLQGVVAVGCFGRGNGGIGSVDAGCGGQHEFADAPHPAQVEQVQGPDDVRLHECPGVFDARPHPCTGRQVDHPVECRQACQGGTVGDIQFMEVEGGQGPQPTQAVLLHADIVGVVQVVHAGDGVTLLDQHFRGACPDEPGCAGDQIVCHAPILPHRRPSCRL